MTARVTPASSRSREARPGLSRGIKLPGKRRGGAPRGERAAISPLPHPTVRPMDGCACRRSASPPWGDFLKWLLQDSGADASREGERFFTSPSVRGEVEERSDEGEGAFPRF